MRYPICQISDTVPANGKQPKWTLWRRSGNWGTSAKDRAYWRNLHTESCKMGGVLFLLEFSASGSNVRVRHTPQRCSVLHPSPFQWSRRWCPRYVPSARGRTSVTAWRCCCEGTTRPTVRTSWSTCCSSASPSTTGAGERRRGSDVRFVLPVHPWLYSTAHVDVSGQAPSDALEEKAKCR